MRANIPTATRNRLQRRLDAKSRLDGGLDDTLMLSLLREAQPLPETVEPERVRALHSSQLLDLIRNVLHDHDRSWTQRMETLGSQIQKLQEEKTTAQAQRDATRRYELPRMASLIEQERARAEQLTGERDALAKRVEELESAAEQAREASRSRLGRLERAVELLEVAGEERAALKDRAETAETKLSERTERATAMLADRERQIAHMRRAGVQLTATLRAHQQRVAAVKAEATGLREERELVGSALAAADEVLAALQGEFKAASTVQRVSKRLGTITAPKGADHLRDARTDYPLFGELMKAQKALTEGYQRVGDASRELDGIRKAVGDRLQGTVWLKQELRQARQSLADTRALAQQLERERRVAEDELSEQARRIIDLEDKVTAMGFEDAQARHDREMTSRELEIAQRKLDAERIRCSQLRAARATERAQIEGEAIKALQEADAERERLQAQIEEAREVGQTHRLKVERLMKALHRDAGDA